MHQIQFFHRIYLWSLQILSFSEFRFISSFLSFECQNRIPYIHRTRKLLTTRRTKQSWKRRSNTLTIRSSTRQSDTLMISSLTRCQYPRMEHTHSFLSSVKYEVYYSQNINFLFIIFNNDDCYLCWKTSFISLSLERECLMFYLAVQSSSAI